MKPKPKPKPKQQQTEGFMSQRPGTKFRQFVPLGSERAEEEGRNARERRAYRRRHLQLSTDAGDEGVRQDEDGDEEGYLDLEGVGQEWEWGDSDSDSDSDSCSDDAAGVADYDDSSPDMLLSSVRCLRMSALPFIPRHGPEGRVPGGIDVGSVGYVSPASLPDYSPPPLEWGVPEFSFVGRSNVGKSSIIKAVMKEISGASKLSGKEGPRVGKKPGKTQLVNYYGCWGREHRGDFKPADANMFLVDLPGYGYASTVGKSERDTWEERTLLYLHSRSPYKEGVAPPSKHPGDVPAGMANAFVLLDSRRSPICSPTDLEYLDFLDDARVPHSLLLTKLDKLSGALRAESFSRACEEVRKRHQKRMAFANAGVLGCSSATGEGVKELVDFMVSGGVWRDKYFV